MNVWIYSIASVFMVSLISLIGVATLSFGAQRIKKIILFLVSFAVGALFGDAIIHLLPETFEKISSRSLASLLVLGGILLFFILEKFIHWRHCHMDSCSNHWHPNVSISISGNIIHNLIDGMLIGASYSISISLGIATTLAILLHEIPQEIGNFGILIHSGFSVRKALLINFLAALTAFLGVFFSLVSRNYVANFTSYLIPIAAGGFLYIAGSDLIPELKHETKIAASVGQLAAIIFGIAVMASLLLIE
ncbi:MAG: hypothetical protein A3J76_02920 [Candidatus Moranbacteria bacterium RBG_13_45_13]|nr:MAG: hypothetical protein A3J76_02920 [Candidatus Moranbacteria bacterium RBG_13_45_13]